MTDSVIRKIREKIKSYKKEDYIVILLVGVLLVIIFLPSDKEKEKKTIWNSQKEGKSEITSVINENENVAGMSNFSYQMGEGVDAEDDYHIYIADLERRTENILSGMAGAGEVKVMIMTSDCGELVTQKDSENRFTDLQEEDSNGGTRKSMENQIKEEVVYTVDKAGNKVPYVVQRKLPQITGVVVASQGAGNTEVKENIIEAVSVLFHINEHRIKVIKMKS